HQNFNLPQLHDNLFGLGSLNRHSWSSAFLTIGADHCKGGGSVTLREQKRSEYKSERTGKAHAKRNPEQSR
ncbi:MAG: hypothetical protein WA790_06485, partial [Sulfitobacter sp.]